LAAAVSSPAIREQVERLQDLWAIQHDIKHLDAAAAATLIESWHPSRELWLYPWLLSVLLTHGYAEEVIVGHAQEILDRDPARDRFSTYFSLSLNVTERLAREGRAEGTASATYLEASLPKWRSEISVENNIRAYKLLARLRGPNAQSYAAEAGRWLQAKIEIDHKRLLPQLVARKEFFVLFHEYFNLMEAWGLTLDVDERSHYQRLRSREDARRQQLLDWEDRFTRLVPVRIDGRTPIVSSDFLCLGTFLFGEPFESEPELSEYRRVVNEMAKKFLPVLLDGIRTMSGVPEFIAQVFNEQSARLEQTLAA